MQDKLDFSTNKIVVCIPIVLESREAIARALIDKYGINYLFLGAIFYDKTTDESCSINICNYLKPNEEFDLIESFKSLGQDRLSATTLEKLDNYQQIVYLISHNVGYDACLKMARYTQVFLNIGGIAVKVDSTGSVCDRKQWLANYNSEDAFDICSLFVTLVKGDNYYYSCGMSNFGKADVSLEITEEIGLAIYVMNVFNYYRLTESVILKDGQTFQPDIECPIYQMQWQEYGEYELNDPLNNCYGRWHLSRFTEDLDISYQIN